MPLFSDLLANAPDVVSLPTADCPITAPISEDNRTVQPGGVFVARKGQQTDSHAYISAAIAAGAAAIAGERPPSDVNVTVPYAQVKDAQQVIGFLAAAYEEFPSRRLTIIGVTGTDGKTTTTNLIFSILKAAGVKVGMISTVNAVIGDETLATGLHVTTPTAPEVQHYLRRMVEAGLTHCVLETTSHGLAQGRVNGVDYDVAVLTNVTHEHLDFHGSFENYRAAKGLLFDALRKSYTKPGTPKCAVVNGDDPSAAYFVHFGADRRITYSLEPNADLPEIDWKATPQGTLIRLRFNDAADALNLTSALIGPFNVQNILAAVSAAHLLGCTPAQIAAGVEAMPPIPGRMERIDEGQNFLAVVDFAHTPNALRKALEAGRTLTHGRMIAVFGCAGLRDRDKRRLMAETSAQLADISVFTAEDPRTESLDAILEVMAESAIAQGGVEGQTFYRVPDRGAALAFGCWLAKPGDLVIACGKGHEQSMCFGTIEYPWDDRDAMRAALRGSPLRTLPTAT